MFNQAPYPSPDQQQRARQGQSNAAAGIGGGNAGQPNQRQMGGDSEEGDAVAPGIGGSAMGPFGMHHAMSHFGPDGSRVRLAIAHMAMGGAPGGMPGHASRMLMRGQQFAAPIRNMGKPRLTRAFGSPMPIKEPGMADGGAWYDTPFLTASERAAQVGAGASGIGQPAHGPLYGDGSGELGPPTGDGGGAEDSGPGFGGDAMTGGIGGIDFSDMSSGMATLFRNSRDPGRLAREGPRDANYAGPPMGGIGWAGGSRDFDESTGDYRSGTGPMGRGGYSAYGGGIGGYQGAPGAGAGYDRFNSYPGDFYGYGEGPGWGFFGDPSEGGGGAGGGGGIGGDPYGRYDGTSYGGDNVGAGTDREGMDRHNPKEGWGEDEVGAYAPSEYGGFDWSGAMSGAGRGAMFGPIGMGIGALAGGFMGSKSNPGVTPTGTMLGTGEEVDSKSENDAAGNSGGPSGAGGPSGEGTGRDSGNEGAGAGLAADGGGTPGIGARPLDRAPVKGPGTGRSDSIPAQLSDGEHVIPADVVAGLGDGSSDAGHRILNAMIVAKRKKYRQHLGKLPPPKE